MLASQLREKLEVWEQVETRNEYGAPIKTDQKVADVWAEVTPKAAGVATDQDRVLYIQEIDIMMRIWPEMKYNYYVVYREQKYWVKSIYPLIDRSGQKVIAFANAV